MRYFKMWWLYITLILYSTNLTTGDQPKIVIVGAGAAGIAAASKLYENGFEDVTILEAENRIGGRVYTTWFDESWVDLGGQWVHGQTNNIVFELASPLGLLEIPQESEELYTTIYNSDGSQIPTTITRDFYRTFLDVQESADEDFKGNNGSVGDYWTRAIIAETTKFPAANQTLVRQFIKLFEGSQNALDGSDNWYDTSVRGQVESWDCPGSSEVNWKDRGYGTILDILMKKYPNPENELPVRNNTILSSEVVNIDYNSTEGKVLIESSNGETYIADHVIVTPSLGVLKEQYETLFTPQLPESKVRTIKGLAMGAAGKIYLSFERPWWPNDSAGFTFMWSETDRQEYENDDHKKWMLDVIAFWVLPNRPRLLLGWINGPGVRTMETLPEHQVLNQTLSMLDKFLGNSHNITTPSGFLRTNWYNNKHFRGAYSFRSMETEAADVWADGLAAPLFVNDKPIVMFAGEATHPHYYSNVHGAVESGFREANRLIEMYNITVPE